MSAPQPRWPQPSWPLPDPPSHPASDQATEQPADQPVRESQPYGPGQPYLPSQPYGPGQGFAPGQPFGPGQPYVPSQPAPGSLPPAGFPGSSAAFPPPAGPQVRPDDYGPGRTGYPPAHGGYPDHQFVPPTAQPSGAHPTPAPQREPDIAEWWERLLARLADSLAFTVVQVVLGNLFYAMFGPSLALDGSGYFYVRGSVIVPAVLAGLVAAGLYAGYDYAMHRKFGATCGKMLFKLKLARLDRQPPTQSEILRRSLAYPGVFAVTGLFAGLSGMPIGLGVTLVILVTLADGVALFTDQVRVRSLHDRLGGTVVVKRTGQPKHG